MVKKKRNFVKECAQELDEAILSGNDRRIALAHSYLAHANIQAKKPKDGIKNFSKALKLADKIGDPYLRIQIKGTEIIAFQAAGRLPDAFKSAQEIEALADEIEDLGIKIKALISQGQIQMDSGDPVTAFNMLSKAQELAESDGGKEDLMNVYGALANFNIQIASHDKAIDFNQKAIDLAKELDNKEMLVSFLLNMASIYRWNKNYSKAIEYYDECLPMVDNDFSSSQVQKSIMDCYLGNEDFRKAQEIAEDVLQNYQDNQEVDLLPFYDLLINQSYKAENFEKAHELIHKGIEYTKKAGNRDKVFEYQLSLGESYILSGQDEEALEALKKALELTQRLQKKKEKAFILGRIGYLYAEGGETEQAIEAHKSAIDISREFEMKKLEAEQLTLLAMAYFEREEYNLALENSQQAEKIYSFEGMGEDLEKIQIVIEQIKSTQQEQSGLE